MTPPLPGLVTGEAVAVDLQHAKLASRGLAFGIDVFLQLSVLVVLSMTAIPLLRIDDALAATVFLLVTVLVLVGYPVICETLSRGRTIGKLALGLRVVRDDGGPIRFRHALARGLAGFFVDFWALGLGGVVAVVVSLSSQQGKRVGDYLAGTVVINTWSPRPSAPPAVMPAPLAGWAAGLDVSGLSDDLALAVRQYLGRFHQLTDHAREQLGGQLAAEVEDRIGVACPPGVPPWAYLSAVLAERHDRAQARVAAVTPAAPQARPEPAQQEPAPQTPATRPEPAQQEQPEPPPGPFAPPA